MAGTSYDIVVVGAGAAGCVVAARLAETRTRSVLLIEAGPDLRPQTPDELRDGWSLSRQPDWGFKSEPDDRGTIANLWRHKLVGGTSWATRFAVRGSPADFNEWAARGNAGWGFDHVLPYFNKLETEVDYPHNAWHGSNGPIPITRYLDLTVGPAGEAAMVALEHAGFHRVEDHNQPWAVGAGPMPMSARNGRRVTTADAYLRVDETPSNLDIVGDTLVSHVIVTSGVASGVRLQDGSTIGAGLVVLSAGTYGSPALLMRSGIGPAPHLRSLGIAVSADLPGVGSALTDHPAVSVEHQYLGIPRSSPILHTIATFHSDGTPDTDAPDLMLWVSEPEPDDAPVFAIDAVLMKPRSQGSVRLRSADPAEAPLVRLPALDDREDVWRLAEAARRAGDVLRHPAIEGMCRAQPTFDGSTDLMSWVRANRYSLPHVVGTCAMGPMPDQGAVVDGNGAVHGVERLRVIDASIMPSATSGFPHLATIMIAEKLAAQIDAESST